MGLTLPGHDAAACQQSAQQDCQDNINGSHITNLGRKLIFMQKEASFPGLGLLLLNLHSVKLTELIPRANRYGFLNPYL